MWDDVIGQARAVERLRAARGRAGARLPVRRSARLDEGRRRARLRRAAARPAATTREHRDARLALARRAPRRPHDAAPRARAISAEQIDDIIRTASLAPVESDRKVMILDEFHLLDAQGAARLLKTLEEPPASTHFVVLADQVHDDLVTIASRCVRIEFAPIAAPRHRGATRRRGRRPSARRRRWRARRPGTSTGPACCVSDPGLARRRDAFASVPRPPRRHRRTRVDAGRRDRRASPTSRPHRSRRVHAAEIAALEERVAASGERGSGRKTLEDRHKREVRRYRTDELRSGLGGDRRRRTATRSSPARRRAPTASSRAVERIHDALEALERNPNETLLLQSLLLDLPGLSS